MDNFYFDDFFVPDDAPGVEIRPVIRGRVVPMTVKRGIPFADREAAKLAAVDYEVSGAGVKLNGFDQARYTVKLLVSLILTWPFTQADGTPVAISEDAIRQLGAEGVDAIQQEIEKLEQGVERQEVPFAKASGEAS